MAAIRRLIKQELPALRRKSRPVPNPAASEVRDLANEMWSYIAANPCSGMSAIQFGVPWRLFVSIVPPAMAMTGNNNKVHIIGSLASLVPGEVDHFGVFVNPRITKMDSELVGVEVETCVSLPGQKCVVPRALDVRIRYQTIPEAHDVKNHAAAAALRSDKMDGFYSRVFQHEIDHLDGILMTDRHLSRRELEEVFSLEDLAEIDKELGRTE